MHARRLLLSGFVLIGIALGIAWIESARARAETWVAGEVEEILDPVETYFAVLNEPFERARHALEEIVPAELDWERPRELQTTLAGEPRIPGVSLEVYGEDDEIGELTLLARVTPESAVRDEGALPLTLRLAYREAMRHRLEEDEGEAFWDESWAWFSVEGERVTMHRVRPVLAELSDDDPERDHHEELRARLLLLHYRAPVDGIPEARLEAVCDMRDGAFLTSPEVVALPRGPDADDLADDAVDLHPETLGGRGPLARDSALLRVRVARPGFAWPPGVWLAGLGVALLVAGTFRAARPAPVVAPTDLTGEAAHEMRTPLTVMRGKLEVALRREREPDAYRQTLRDCLIEVDALEHLQDAILLLSRAGPSTLHRESVDLVDLVRAEMRRVEEAAPERMLSLDAPAEQGLVVEGLVVEGDPSLLARAIGNLLDNAARYSVPNGAIRVAVRRDGAHVEVAVEDDGPGIPPERHARVFERFYRGPDVGRRGLSGCGLGLPIVARIAELHGGRAQLDAQVQGRCRFLLRVSIANMRTLS
ncbi:MAG: ATP-binding protein [Planctomycetota bacterium]